MATFQPLTREQYNSALKAGFTPEQIIANEKKRKEQSKPKQSMTSIFAGGLKDYATNVAPQVIIGGAKGALSTAQGLANLGQGALNATVGKVMGVNRPLAQMPESWTKPSNVFQEGGKFGEQVAEFAIPAGTVSKASKAVEASKAPRLVRYLAKPVAEGLGAGGVVAAQTGEIGKDARNATLAVGGLTLGGKLINSIAQKIPKTAWSQILKQSPVETIKKPKLAEQASKTGLTGLNRESIQKQAQQNIQSLEMSLDDLLTTKQGIKPYQRQFVTTAKNVSQPLIGSYSTIKKTGGNISTKEVVKYLDDLKTSYSMIPGEQSSVESIDKVAKDLLRKPTLTPLEANQLKQTIYRHIKNTYGKGLLEIPPTAQAQKQIARGLKNEIEKIIPEAKTITEKQAIYINIDKQLEKAISRTQGKGVMGTGVGLYDILIGGAGQLSGYGLAPLVAKKAAESTAVLSGTSKLIQYFNSLSPTKKILFYNAIKGLTAESTRNKK